MPITIQISDKQWDFLNRKKKRGESFQDVLDRIILMITKLKLHKELQDIK